MDSVSDSAYYKVCFIFLVIAIAGACSISNLSFVFGMIGAWNETLLNYVFPGLFYLKACKVAAEGNIVTKIVAVFFCVFGLFYFCLSNYYNYIKI